MSRVGPPVTWARGRAAPWIVLTVISAFLVPGQARLNAGLALALDDPIAAAFVSFGSGLVVVLAVGLVRREWRGSLVVVVSAVRDRRILWWQLGSGVVGASIVLAQSAVAPLIGVALLTVALVAGQSVGGLLVDRLGIAPAGRLDPTRRRVIGATLVVVAVLVSMWPRLLVDVAGGPDQDGPGRGAPSHHSRQGGQHARPHPVDLGRRARDLTRHPRVRPRSIPEGASWPLTSTPN